MPGFVVICQRDRSRNPAGGHVNSRHRTWIEKRQIVVDSPTVGPRLHPATGDVQDQLEKIQAGFFDGGFAGRNSASVKINEIGPALRKFRSRGDLDDGSSREAVRRAAPGREDLKRNAGGKLQSGGSAMSEHGTPEIKCTATCFP